MSPSGLLSLHYFDPNLQHWHSHQDMPHRCHPIQNCKHQIWYQLFVFVRHKQCKQKVFKMTCMWQIYHFANIWMNVLKELCSFPLHLCSLVLHSFTSSCCFTTLITDYRLKITLSACTQIMWVNGTILLMTEKNQTCLFRLLSVCSWPLFLFLFLFLFFFCVCVFLQC